MTDPTDLIARADAAIKARRCAASQRNAAERTVDMATLVPALRDALAAALTRAENAQALCDKAQAQAFAMIDKRNELMDRLEAAIDRVQAAECHAEAMEADRDRLRALLDTDPTDAAIASACLSYRHDFGLLDDKAMRGVIWDAREWWRAVQREMRARAALTGAPQP